MKALVQAPPVQSSVSWWLTAPRNGFTRHVTLAKDEHGQTHQARMSASKLGKGRNRPISSIELEPR